MKKALLISLSLLIFIAFAEVKSVETYELYANDTLVYLNPKEEHPIEMQYISSLLNQFHYRKAPLDDSLSSVVFDNYIDALDPGKMYFLKADIEYFEKYRYTIDDDFKSGKLDFPFQIFHVRRERAIDRMDYVTSLLETEMDFSTNEEYEFDRESATWANEKADWDELWRKYIKNQALSYKLKGKEWTEISSALDKRYKQWRKAIYQNKSEDVFQTFMNSFTTTFDPHTDYFSPKAAEDFNINMSLSLEGIGARLSQNLDYTEIAEIVVGGPAYRSKDLFKNDKIIGVAQGDKGEIVDVVGWRVDDVVQLIRGKKGSIVRLLISRADAKISDAPDTVRLVRDKINLDDQASTGEIIPISNNGTTFKLGVIGIPKFYRNFEEARIGSRNYRSTTRDVKDLIDSLNQEGMDGLMIDLRFNGGGALEEAVELTGLFIPEGPVVQVKDFDQTVDKLRDNDGKVFYDGPLAVLINRFSASASEIFSGAIQDYRRGVVLGETTFGKGTVQNLISLNRVINTPGSKLGQVKLTRAKFYRVTGSSTQHEGVTPDIQFPSIYSAEEYGESSRPSALPWDKISSSNFTQTNEVSQEMLDQLYKLYQSDLTTDPVLKKLVSDINKNNEERTKTSISLNLDERKKLQEKNEKEDELATEIETSEIASEEAEDERIVDDPYLKEGLKLLAELAKMQVG